MQVKTNTKFTDAFSEETYLSNYKFHTDTNIDSTHFRVAQDLASCEEDPEHWTVDFLYALEDFKFVPGGRITSNAGTGLSGTTYINCFVDGFIGENQDSMESIQEALCRQAMILKSEGGYGFCADALRPRGAFIEGIANEGPGSVKMLEMWDKQSEIITQGSGQKKKKKRGKDKIRKGAQMVTMSCWHPDIEEFITAKQTPGRLTKFNMSSLIPNGFMEAVENHEPWELQFPDYEEDKEGYNQSWDGNLGKWIEEGRPVKTYKTFKDANELWDLIMTSTHNRNEPGVLFVDTINYWNNLWYCEYISATNPCGEQVLPVGGACLLGSLNLTQFIDFENRDWDYKKLGKVIPMAVRMLDNVNDCTLVPLESQKENLQEKRRIGLGYFGYGSALLMLRIRYGSKKALELTEKLGDFVANAAYQASALLASEKGSFPLYKEKEYLQGAFVKTLSRKTRMMIKKYGIRNSHLLSIQPTGNSSIFANNISGGLEPLFNPEYYRTSIQPHPPEGMVIPTNVDWENKKYTSETKWNWTKEGDESILVTTFEDEVWKFDRSRGLLKETQVVDYGVRYLKDKGQWNSKAKWAATTTELTIDEHVDTMEVFSRYVDSAMSKTVNIPNDYPYEDFKTLYFKMFKSGTIKGCTSYRAGTMASVLATESTSKTMEGSSKIVKTICPKRPKELDCEIHHMTYKGAAWLVLVGIHGEEPYEVFAFRSKDLEFPKNIKTGTLTKVRGGKYDLAFNGFKLKNVASHFERDEEEVITRLISASLRHGTDVEIIVDQLLKAEGNILSFNRVIARCLKKYIKECRVMKCAECQSKRLIMTEGCFKCTDCGFSKCQ